MHTKNILFNNSTSDLNSGFEVRDVISDVDAQVIQFINSVILNGLIGTFGMVTNLINMVVFVRQGFQDSVNISLCGLAASDFGSVLALVWLSVCANPLVRNSRSVPFVAFDVQYLTAGWPHVYFTRVTGWITAFVTLERCLCIALPLKVKTILTTTRVKYCIAFIYVAVAAGVAPIYYTSQLSWVFFTGKNRTLLALTVTEDRVDVESVTFAINNVLSPVASFAIVLACTVVLVAKLNKKSKWRQEKAMAISKHQPGTGGQSTSVKDRKVIKMVTVISSIFIFSFTPTTIFFAYMAINPDFGAGGRFENIFNVVFSFSFLLEAINSNANILVYYNMSSRFKSTLLSLFSLSSQLPK